MRAAQNWEQEKKGLVARKPRTKKVAAKPSGENLESLLERIRSLWNATDQADTAVRDWSRKAIVDAIVRLDRKVTSKLRLADPLPPGVRRSDWQVRRGP